MSKKLNGSNTQQSVEGKEDPMRKVAMIALAGTSIEWYDFFLYATAAALVFPAAFFPDSSPTVGLILSFGTFAFGFIARPIGGIVFGHFGDRIGRKRTLVIALLLMGVASKEITPNIACSSAVRIGQSLLDVSTSTTPYRRSRATWQNRAKGT